MVRAAGLPVVGQRGGSAEAPQRVAPELFGGPGVLVGEPGHVVAERRAERQCRFRRAAVGVRAPQRAVAREHVGQHLKGAPAVQQQVVEGPQHLHRVPGQRRERHPHQRGGRQVQTRRLIPLEQLVQRGPPRCVVRQAAPVEMPDRQRHRTVHGLQRLVQPVAEHAGAQDRRTVDHLLPGLAEQPRIGHAVQDEGDLLHVQRPVRLGHAVEEHAALHRGQRVEVLDGTAVAGHLVEGRLVESGQREVGRGDAAGGGVGAVPQDLPQRLGGLFRQPLHGLLVVHVLRVVPGHRQLTGLHAADRVQQVRPQLPGVPGELDPVAPGRSSEPAAAPVSNRPR